MARKSFLYFLFGPNNKPLYVDDNGFVKEGNEDFMKPDGQPASLNYSPIGWKDKIVKYARNIKYWGIFRDMTVPLKFPGDGFEILNKMFWDFGMEVVVQFVVLKLDRLNLPYTYKGWYKSELNFPKFKQSLITYQVEALEGGLSKYLKANENTDYEIPIDTDPEHFNVLMDGIYLYGKQNFISITDFIFTEDIFLDEIALPWIPVTSEGNPPYVQFFQTQLEIAKINNSTFDYAVYSPNYCIYISQDAPGPITLNIVGKVRFQITTMGTVRSFRLTRWRSSLNSTPTDVEDNIIFNDLINNTDVQEYSIDETIVAQPGDKIMYTFSRNPAAQSSDMSEYKFVEGTELTVNFKSRNKPTITKCLYSWTVFKRLVEKATDGKYTAKSSWLETKKDIALTSGDGLRGIVTTEDQTGAYIKTNISDFLKSMNHWCVGMGIENDQLVMELFPYFFKSEQILDFQQMTDPEVIMAEDLLFNTIKTGGPRIEYDDVNGKYEFNQGQVWGTAITKYTKELDLTTPYRRDPYGMEFIRKEMVDKDTTDRESDDNVFMINIETELQEETDDYPAHYLLYRPVYTTISGVPDFDGIFNTELTGVHTLKNNGRYIRSVMDKMDTTSITLKSKDKNSDLKTTGGPNGNISLNDPLQVGGLGEKIFLPYYLTGVCEIQKNLLEIMEVNPYGFGRVEIEGSNFYGFLMDGSIKPATNDKQNPKLLLTVNNDPRKIRRR